MQSVEASCQGTAVTDKVIFANILVTIKGLEKTAMVTFNRRGDATMYFEVVEARRNTLVRRLVATASTRLTREGRRRVRD